MSSAYCAASASSTKRRFLSPPAGARFLHVVYTPWIEGDGQVAGWMASVSDITDLKRTTKALRDSEERLRLAMSSGTIGVWDWDVSSGRLTVSPEVGRIYGLDVTNLRSYEDFAARVHPDDLAAIESERDAAIHNHEPFDTEFRIVLPSGEIRWIAVQGAGVLRRERPRCACSREQYRHYRAHTRQRGVAGTRTAAAARSRRLRSGLLDAGCPHRSRRLG